LKGQGFVFVEGARYQLRQADGVEQAGSNAPWKSFTATGDEWQSRPQRVARRGVGVVGQGVEEEIRQAMPREVVLQGQ
jgi:hypothetical protein